MMLRKNSRLHLNLLLSHIIATFQAHWGILWFAGTDSLYSINSQNGRQSIAHKKSLVNFLAGYYYSFLRFRNKYKPYIIDNLFETRKIPENIIELVTLENVTSLLIAPILFKNHMKGTLLLGSDNPAHFSKIDFDLLKLLTDSAFHLHNTPDDSCSTLDDNDLGNKSFGAIVGASSKMQEIYQTINKISQSDANVFIYGESGTGKELIARTIHAHSQRKDQAFIPVDCVALPQNLLESELFGYEKGAFTGAHKVKRGLIEYADKGTFFLDEITEMNIELQAKLLRVLQERKFRRISGKALIDLDIRIISATNLDPNDSVSKKVLREDLYYRLHVIPIFIPPLRERLKDIPLLVEHFICELSTSNQANKAALSESALQVLMDYQFPGNVRELRNLIERLIVLAKSDIITVEDLPKEMTKNRATTQAAGRREQPVDLPYNEAKAQSLLSFERSYFSNLLDRHHGNISRVANEAKVSRKTIYNILKKHSFDSYQNLLF